MLTHWLAGREALLPQSVIKMVGHFKHSQQACAHLEDIQNDMIISVKVGCSALQRFE